MNESSINIVETLEYAARQNLGIVRILHGHSTWTELNYQTILERAQSVAGYLISVGLQPHDRVAIVHPTQPEFYDCFFGCMIAGIVPCALYPPMRFGLLDQWQQQTSQMISQINAKLVLADRRFCGILKNTVSIPIVSSEEIAAAHAAPHFKSPAIQPHDTAVIQFSSGTTGLPKPISLSHSNISYTIRTIVGAFPPSDYTVGVSWLPLYHDLGLFGSLMVGLVCKGELNLIAPEIFLSRPRVWLETISERKASISPAPNFAFGLCTKKIADVHGLDLSSWRLAICAAETIHYQTIQNFTAKFAPCGFNANAITPGYGLAESTLAVTMNDWRDPPHWLYVDATSLLEKGIVEIVNQEESVGETVCLASLGRPFPQVEIAIKCGASPEVSENSALRLGHVLIKSPGIYHGFGDDWLDTGDLGFMVSGELYLFGRSKDTVIIRGRNYDPSLIESAVLGVDGVREGCCVCFSTSIHTYEKSVDHSPKTDTEKLVLMVEPQSLHADPKTLESAIQTAVLNRLHLKPDLVVIVPAGTIPRTSSGKLSRSKAKALWEQNRLISPKKFGAASFLMKSVKGKLGMRPKQSLGL